MSLHEWLGAYDTGGWYAAAVIVVMAVAAIKAR